MEGGSLEGREAVLFRLTNEIRSEITSMGGIGAMDGEQPRQRSSGKSLGRV
jgi:hypothetical protein